MNSSVAGIVGSIQKLSIEDQGRSKIRFIDVLSFEKGGEFSYAVQELRDDKHRQCKFGDLLDRAKERQKQFLRLCSNVYEHNSSSFSYASPITFSDDRMRFAVREPTEIAEIISFWEGVLAQDTTLIVMVKDSDGTTYFPLKADEKLTFEANGTVEISCTRKMLYPELGATFSDLVVNGKRLYHLQINWAEYMGMKEEHLYMLIHQVRELELNNPGSTVVHCRAGVGRTGTFFACLLLTLLVEESELLHKQYLHLDKLLFFLREMRPNMIESEEQLQSILDFQKYLTIQEETKPLIDVRDIPSYSPTDVFDFHVHGFDDIQLAWFQASTQLERVAMRMCGMSLKSVWVGDCSNDLLSNLTSLALENSYILDDAVTAIARLEKLATLSLKRSSVNEFYSIEPLAESKTITILDLRGLRKMGISESVPLGGPIHLLKEKMPNTVVHSEYAMIDHRDYRGILCTNEDREDYRYCFKGTATSFNGLLSLASRYQAHWEILSNNVYTHNFSDLHGASPIKCLDARVRIAAALPCNEAWFTVFWNYVLTSNVGLIVMVLPKSMGTYYPKTAGESITNDDITVTCKATTSGEKDCFSTLEVNGKPVEHMQIEWSDNQGIDPNLLYHFIQEVKKREAATPEQMTLVHCHAGIGRTGTFFGCFILDQLLEERPNFSPSNDYLNLRTLVFALRSQRAGMIEANSQLETITAYPEAFISARAAHKENFCGSSLCTSM